MKTMDLPKISTVKPPWQKPTASDNCKNILAQNFNQSKFNSVWVCDFTYIRVGTRYYYLYTILDLYARKIIAYKLSKRMDMQLAIDTLDLAVANRGESSENYLSFRQRCSVYIQMLSKIFGCIEYDSIIFCKKSSL